MIEPRSLEVLADTFLDVFSWRWEDSPENIMLLIPAGIPLFLAVILIDEVRNLVYDEDRLTWVGVRLYQSTHLLVTVLAYAIAVPLLLIAGAWYLLIWSIFYISTLVGKLVWFFLSPIYSMVQSVVYVEVTDQ